MEPVIQNGVITYQALPCPLPVWAVQELADALLAKTALKRTQRLAAVDEALREEIGVLVTRPLFKVTSEPSPRVKRVEPAPYAPGPNTLHLPKVRISS